jgi:hypothetical protein
MEIVACLWANGQALAPEKRHNDATKALTTVVPAMPVEQSKPHVSLSDAQQTQVLGDLAL